MEKEKRKRAGNPRSKKGCRTCRIRRIKCDEQKPACLKCTSTGRACEWFSPFKADQGHGSHPRLMHSRSNSTGSAGSSSTGGGYSNGRYGSFSSASNCSTTNSPATPPPSAPPSELRYAKSAELRGFEFFTLRTATELSHHFDFGFWSAAALQLARVEPLVLHAAIALGTLHEAEEARGMRISRDRTAVDARHRFAVAQYNTAIRCLTEVTGQGGWNNPRHTGARTGESRWGSQFLGQVRRVRVVTLATCLIFVHIELLRGRYEQAIVHIRSGLNILRDRNQMAGFSTHSTSNGEEGDDMERTMATAFARLDLQCAHFDSSSPYLPYPTGEDAESFHALQLPLGASRFESVAEAKRCYDLLLGSTFQLLRVCERHLLAGSDDHLYDAMLQVRRTVLLGLHEDYIQGVELRAREADGATSGSGKGGENRNELGSSSSGRDAQALLLLQMHLRLTRVLLSVCMAELHAIEGAFDQHACDFAEIVFLARQFVSRFDGRRGTLTQPPSLSTDWGIIPPLTFTAIKCRTPAIRHAALALLDGWPHREGFWDSALAATYARQVVDIEESAAWSSACSSGCVSTGCGSGRSSVSSGGSTPQELEAHVQRTTNVYVVVPEDQLHGTIEWEWAGTKDHELAGKITNRREIEI